MDNLTKRNILRKTIVLCWSALIICFFIKLLGGNYFEIFAKNEKFIELCNWVDGNFIGTIIMYGFYWLNFYLISAIICEHKLSDKKLLITIPLAITSCFIKGFSSIIGVIVETLFMIITPILIGDKGKKRICIRFVITYILMNVFQLISLFIRNFDVDLLGNSLCVNMLFQVDYYIMIILYYIYSVKLKGEKK